jgi:Helitron helicase-like domain at N-terminus
LHIEVYSELVNTVATNTDVNMNDLGKHFILLSSFVGSTHNMQQYYQDALAINHYFGGGDLFITITANPTWPKIQAALLYNQTASDHPDLVVHVCHAKLCSLI